MKYFLLLLFIPVFLGAQSTGLYEDDQIASIFIELPQDSFELILEEQINERYLRARFIFDDGVYRDTVEEIGLRLRGNTSLSAAKKSFKVSFNEYVSGREYQGVRKLNLRGQANDPTLIREKLYYEIWKNAGMVERRAAFVRLFVNGEYRGLYTNIEELDKQWLDRAYDDNDGNLYKCLYPADLVWLGADQNTYKNILHGSGDRAYRLVTNETADDYSRFVALVQAINQPLSATYAENLRGILNVDGVIKAYAIDIATGNWDNYFYLKNNYYLYDNPVSGRFEWIAYDTDNCMGVDWLGRDWALRDCLDWENHSEARPLASRLMEVPEFKQQLVNFLDSLSRYITCPDVIFPRIDELHALVTPDAITDPFRSLDFGYSVADFHASYDQALDSHTPYGLKPFLTARCAATGTQLAGLVINKDVESESGIRLFPNPTHGTLAISNRDGAIVSLENEQVQIWNTRGQLADEVTLENGQINTAALPSGLYCLTWRLNGQLHAAKFLKL
jgi:spore coat protein H